MTVYYDRVQDTSTTTSTGNFTLSGTAPTGKRTFASAYGSAANWVPYCIAHQSATEWEVGLGTLSSSTTLARSLIFASSNSNAAVNFSAGTKDVFATIPATFETALQRGKLECLRLGITQS